MPDKKNINAKSRVILVNQIKKGIKFRTKVNSKNCASNKTVLFYSNILNFVNPFLFHKKVLKKDLFFGQ